MSIKGKGPPDNEPSPSETDDQKVLESKNITHAKCCVCGEPLRPQDFEICGTCKTWGNYALFLKPLRGG